MKKYTYFSLLLIGSLLCSCHDKEFETAEDLETLLIDIADKKNATLTENKTCLICEFETTASQPEPLPSVIYCDNGDNEVLQVSKGIPIILKGITLAEQIEKVEKKASCKSYP